MKTIVRSNKHMLALVLTVTLVLTGIFGLLIISHSKAASPASLEEKKAGWYAVRSGAVDLSCNGVLQNKYGSWFVEDGRVNFGYTGWLVCEGTSPLRFRFSPFRKRRAILQLERTMQATPRVATLLTQKA